MSVKLRLERKAKGRTDSLHVVEVDGKDVGFVTKYANTRSEKHPWKAFAGIGMNHRYLGAFYAGKGAAVEAVVKGS